MKNVILRKENGEVIEIALNDEAIKMVKGQCPRTSCFECVNARANRCEKVADDEGKKNIGEYNFITDGYQSYDANGNIKSFVVSKCNNFMKEEPRKNSTTREEIERLNYLRTSIKILYFDAETIEEANQIQEDLMRRGQLLEYDAYREGNLMKRK